MIIEIRKLINKILGNVTIHCETLHDEEVYKNLDLYKEALDEICDSLVAVALYKGDHRGSADKCGTKAFEILKDVENRLFYVVNDNDDEDLF